MIQSRQVQLGDLSRERDRILRQLTVIDEKIRKLGGTTRGSGLRGATAAAVTRARNPKSLVKTLEDVLAGAGGPMSVSDIVNGVEASGYHSTSDNFRAIINQTLIKERKRFANTGRAMYAINAKK
jgi:hypothetical protein